MKLTILGYSGPFPKAGGASSGYLIESENTQILLDLGSGTLANFQKISDFENINSIFLSHLHSDHIADLFVLRYAFEMLGIKNIPLFTLDEPKDVFKQLEYNDIFNIIKIDDDDTCEIDNLTFSFKQSKHPIPTLMVKIIDDLTGKTFVYSADTAYFDELVSFCDNADLLLLDCAMDDDNKIGLNNHMSVTQALDLARKTEAQKTILTHLNPLRDEKLYIKDAEKCEYKNYEFAEILKTYEL